MYLPLMLNILEIDGETLQILLSLKHNNVCNLTIPLDVNESDVGCYVYILREVPNILNTSNHLNYKKMESYTFSYFKYSWSGHYITNEFSKSFLD
ncbi:uncharacterized protein VNE69_04031 [Vairimorpha necatrix]|uniref:Uncharacterized protein n=1 Tax=Vairimorpha necatrix TaxID=6039 RepID=A0AAX4JBB3_9MICR